MSSIAIHEVILSIVEDLVKDGLSGHYPHRTCANCTGEDSGYPYSQEFEHRDYCVTYKIAHLAALVRGEQFLEEKYRQQERDQDARDRWERGE